MVSKKDMKEADERSALLEREANNQLGVLPGMAGLLRAAGSPRADEAVTAIARAAADLRSSAGKVYQDMVKQQHEGLVKGGRASSGNKGMVTSRCATRSWRCHRASNCAQHISGWNGGCAKAPSITAASQFSTGRYRMQWLIRRAAC